MALDSRSNGNSPTFEQEGRLRHALISFLNGLALAAIAPLGLLAWLEARLSPQSEGGFLFGAQWVAGVPGLPGVYIRRAFYRWTLRSCSLRCYIGYGAYFTHRQAVVGDHVYVGPYSLIGSAHLDPWCLIGSRASLLSRGALHSLDDEGRWRPTDLTRLEPIHVGAHAWVGEGAILMADVGSGAMIAAGSVVSSPVAAGVLVAGNPARFVRNLGGSPACEAAL